MTHEIATTRGLTIRIGTTTRGCGSCSLCCRLLPVKSLGKADGVRCRHQRHNEKGCCRVYADLRRVSRDCHLWSCRWLVDDDTHDLPRPDRSHLVIDIVPDFVTLQENETGKLTHIEVVQVWMDPAYPDAHREPRFRAYVERRAAEGVMTLIRTSARDGFALAAPALSTDHQWHEVASNTLNRPEHSAEEIAAVLGAPERER
jgi:hypothetical protein